ncbi:unnamed protein product [Caenorhabditis sp. 36 PRJEB53466]|nr:unnamed protein product [Caenorhabditis sp. 36 PRJEB53466]
MTKYVRVKETYFGCISVQYFAILSSCITLGTQLAFSIFFLIYGQLWGLIPLVLTIASHLFFMITISQFQSTISMSIYSGIEITFAFTILGFAVWILSWILDPTQAFIYSFCVNKLKYTNCYGRTQLDSFIWGVLFIIFFFVSVILLPVYKNTWRNIKATRKSSSVYIDGDKNQGAPVQPIFNINSAPPQPPAPPPVPPQILLPQQFLSQPGFPQLQTQQPVYPGQASSIMTSMGTIHLNLYSIQLPNGTSTFLSPSPVIEQLGSNFSDSASQCQAEQMMERL